MATGADRDRYLVKDRRLVKLDVPRRQRLLNEALILSGLFARLNYCDLLGDRLQNQLLQARVDELVRLGQVIKVNTWVCDEAPVIFGS